MNLLFAADSILVSENKREYDRMVSEAGGNIAVAERRLFESVDAEFGGHSLSAEKASFEKPAMVV
jgi:hypothetical protein